MDEYTAFAYIYDEFMDNIPYEESVSYLHDLLVENGVDKGTIVELGCGTGRITRMLAGLGYDMVGIDISEDMLTQAGSTEYADGESNDVSDSKCSGSIIYSLQDMKEFAVPYKVNAVVSISDSMNYITNPEDLKLVFDRVRECLEDDGVFIFDLKTDYLFKHVMGNETRTDIREDAVLIWENEYDEEKKNNIYYLTMFISDDAEEADIVQSDSEEDIAMCASDSVSCDEMTDVIQNGMNELESDTESDVELYAEAYMECNDEDREDNTYSRYEEVHVQHAYSIDEIKDIMRGAKLDFIYAYEAYGRKPADEKSERIYYVCRKL